MNKTFKTLDEQINILQSKGLIINDVFEAKEILLRENYFFLNGYRLLFMISENDRSFVSGSDFDELYAMFHFDRHIRNIIFKNLLIIENNIKSIIAYNLSMRYGYRERQYLDPKNFTNDRKRKKQVDDLLRKMKRQIRINGGQHQATMHYMDKYGYIPLWIVVKILSFGIVGELYQILKFEDQNSVAQDFNISREDLLVYLPILANFRNLCAHEDILYSHRAQRDIDNTRYHQELKIPKIDEEYIYGKNELKYEITALEEKLHSISIEKVLNEMGFPLNYERIVEL